MEPWHRSKTHLPTSAARWRKPDPDGSKLCCFCSILTAAVFSAGLRWGRKGLRCWEIDWFASFGFIVYLLQLRSLSMQLQRELKGGGMGGGIERRISAATRATSNNIIYTESVVVPKPLKVRWGELLKPWKSGFRRMLFCTCNGAIRWHVYVCASPETRGSAQEVAVTGFCQTSVSLSPLLSLRLQLLYPKLFSRPSLWQSLR